MESFSFPVAALIVSLFLAGLLILTPVIPGKETDSKRVLFLHSFGPLFTPWNDYARTIRAEINRQSKWTIDFTDVSLVTARSNDEDPERPLIVICKLFPPVTPRT